MLNVATSWSRLKTLKAERNTVSAEIVAQAQQGKCHDKIAAMQTLFAEIKALDAELAIDAKLTEFTTTPKYPC